MINNELLELIGFLNSELLWLYFIIIVVIFYGVLSLLTWSPKKPLLFLGVPSIIVGVILLILRFSVGMFLPFEGLLIIVNAMLNPLLTISIICVLAGILMIVVYKVLNKLPKKKQIVEKTEI